MGSDGLHYQEGRKGAFRKGEHTDVQTFTIVYKVELQIASKTIRSKILYKAVDKIEIKTNAKTQLTGTYII